VEDPVSVRRGSAASATASRSRSSSRSRGSASARYRTPSPGSRSRTRVDEQLGVGRLACQRSMSAGRMPRGRGTRRARSSACGRSPSRARAEVHVRAGRGSPARAGSLDHGLRIPRRAAVVALRLHLAVVFTYETTTAPGCCAFHSRS
jgi:hypothetical protein